jgi:NAD(P)H-hydrate repair Nnr-like enzyme with NAD(P)H-hydrate epimerase domain
LRLVRAAEMREMDLDATRCYGIPGLILMENAGLSIVKVIMHRFFKGKPRGNARNFIDFVLSPDGQQIVRQNFISISDN